MKFLKYLFIYLAGSNLSCSMRDLHCIMSDLLLCCRLSNSGTQAPEYMGSVVLSRLNALEYVGSYPPDQG